MKNKKTYDLPEKMAIKLKTKRADKSNNLPITLGGDMYSQYEISSIVERKVATDVDQFIIQQEKSMRDLINAEEKRRGTPRNNIDHVTNFINAQKK